MRGKQRQGVILTAHTVKRLMREAERQGLDAEAYLGRLLDADTVRIVIVSIERC